MNNLIMTIILAVGWPILIIGSIYLFIKGKTVYNLVKGSLVGKVVRILVYTMMVEMYSLGVVSTGFMIYSTKWTYIVIPVFIAWFIMFTITMKVLMNAEKEARALSGPATPQI